jgi:HlyD family secretion protein
MNKYFMMAASIILIACALLFLLIRKTKSSPECAMLQVKRETFISDIITTGELEAKNSVLILGPSGMWQFQIYQMTISRIVTEGTVVKKGEWIADLDRSEFNTKVQDTQLEMEKAQSRFLQSQLDTALQMRQARDDLINLKFAVEEAKLAVEQSQYEPPATMKQNEFNLEKARRNYQQATENYKIRENQNKAKMREVNTDLQKNKRNLEKMLKVAELFTVTAPEPGMVIYAKSWDNTTIKAGSQIYSWDPTVAKLPDMSVMISKTYINEVDVRKVKPGQSVEMGLDAFPDKKMSGVVTSVANVGEQRPNSDAKVFEAIIQLENGDYSLRPSMTTSNRIIIRELNNVIVIPAEYLQIENDSITFVYKKNKTGVIKQEVKKGFADNKSAVILNGLSEGDYIYLNSPVDMQKEAVHLLSFVNSTRQIILPASKRLISQKVSGNPVHN